MSGIFLIHDNNHLVKMTEQPYELEAHLQKLLADYPDLLPGDQIDSESPRRWLFISREVLLPSGSLDHLFVDQDAIPTLVEVKRASDTRTRREVVAQMLDYAANAVRYLPVEAITERLGTSCAERGLDANQVISDFIGDKEPEEFWRTFKKNLEDGWIRLIFVADEIPPELQRIVEFLNEQMDRTQVLAVEIRQFKDAEGKLKTLVPRVVGQTAKAQDKKTGKTAAKRQWDEKTFFAEIEARNGIQGVEVARRIFEWALARKLRPWWGSGKQLGSFFPMLDHQGATYWLFGIWTNGYVEIQFQHMNEAPFDEAKRKELLQRINQIPGIAIPPDAFNRRPSIPLATLMDKTALSGFLNTYDRVIQEIKAWQG